MERLRATEQYQPRKSPLTPGCAEVISFNAQALTLYIANGLERINAIDRDGLPVRPGRYRFIEEDREARAEEGAINAPHLNTPIPTVLQLRRCARKA